MIKIHFFAGLTRSFPSSIELEWQQPISVADLFQQLKQKSPDAAGLLSKSRAAINEEFVDLDTLIANHTDLYVIPPSSGG